MAAARAQLISIRSELSPISTLVLVAELAYAPGESIRRRRESWRWVGWVPMPESRVGRPPTKATVLARAISYIRGGGTTEEAALVAGLHRATLSRHAAHDPQLRDLLHAARVEGRTARQEAKSTMPTATDDPVTLLAELQRQRAHHSLDAAEGVAGAAAKLAVVEDRIAEVTREVERNRLAGEERERREQQRLEREREAERRRLKAEFQRLEGERAAAFKALERDLDTMVSSIRNAVELATAADAANVALQRALGDDDFSGDGGWVTSPIGSRVTYRLAIDAGLRRDVNYFPGNGDKPLA